MTPAAAGLGAVPRRALHAFLLSPIFELPIRVLLVLRGVEVPLPLPLMVTLDKSLGTALVHLSLFCFGSQMAHRIHAQVVTNTILPSMAFLFALFRVVLEPLVDILKTHDIRVGFQETAVNELRIRFRALLCLLVS